MTRWHGTHGKRQAGMVDNVTPGPSRRSTAGHGGKGPAVPGDNAPKSAFVCQLPPTPEARLALYGTDRPAILMPRVAAKGWREQFAHLAAKGLSKA